MLGAAAAGARVHGLDAAGVSLAMRIAAVLVLTPSYNNVVVGATALIRHRQHAQQALTPQPAPAPTASATNQHAPVVGSAPVHTERNEPAPSAERSEPATTHRSAPTEPTALERVAAAVADAARADKGQNDRAEARVADRGEHKKAHKHGKHGDEDEDATLRPHDKKHDRHPAARLFDVIH